MKFVPIHSGEVKNLKLIIFHKEKWDLWLRKMEGKKVRIIVEEQKKVRSLKMNNFYRAYLELIEKETGTEPDDMHEIAKRLFLLPRYITFKTKQIKIPGTTTNLDSLEFMEYMEKICQLTEVPIPDPDEVKLNL